MKLKYVFSSLGILICLSVFADGVKPAKVGEQSPDFQFADKNGKMYSLKDFKGQYVFIFGLHTVFHVKKRFLT